MFGQSFVLSFVRGDAMPDFLAARDPFGVMMPAFCECGIAADEAKAQCKEYYGGDF